MKKGMSITAKSILLFSKYRNLFPYIVAQAKHETGNFLSNVFLQNKNYFGMKLARVRPTVAINGGLNAPKNEGTTPYANYKTESDSVVDLLLWFDYTKFPEKVSSSEEYVRELKKRSYFSANEQAYLKAINFFLN